MTLDDEIKAARERIVERELSDPFEIFDATVLFMRPKIDAANAEIAELRETITGLEALVERRADARDALRTVTDAQRKLDAISALHRLSPVPNGKGVTGEWCICGHVRCKERAILEEQPAAEGASS